jgi:hypothetical protein
MSKRKDIDKAAPAAPETAAAPAAEANPATSEQQISLSLSEPLTIEALAVEPIPEARVAVAPKPEALKPVETPKAIDFPKPVEAVMKAVEAMKPAPMPEAPATPPVAASSPFAAAVLEPSRSHKFALLAASVSFAGCVGAMAGALAAAVIAQPGSAPTPLATLDLSSVQDTVAALRTELSSIKTSVDSSTRNSNAQFAKFTERLERIDRAQAAPAAQLRQAMEAIERLERRAQAPSQAPVDTTGSMRAQPAAATPPAATPPAATPAAVEPPRQAVLDGWVVRHVSRGVAVIHGRRIGIIEVEAGDVVPGVGRIESIKRQDGRWVVVTTKGLIRSATGPMPPMPMPR